jgi:hypothetical protein
MRSFAEAWADTPTGAEANATTICTWQSGIWIGLAYEDSKTGPAAGPCHLPILAAT